MKGGGLGFVLADVFVCIVFCSQLINTGFCFYIYIDLFWPHRVISIGARKSICVFLSVTSCKRGGAVRGIANGSRRHRRLRGLNFIRNTSIRIIADLGKGLVIGIGNAHVTVDGTVTGGVVI